MDNILITKEKSIAISYIRVISAMMIVLCHIFQGLNNELAWWFNVGVQIFLFMSGFLMAKSKITNNSKFIKKRFVRILKPYYVALILSIVLYMCIGKEITLSNISTYLFAIQGITYTNTIEGLGHLWFVSLILLCYIITLLLDRYRDIMSSDKGFMFYLKLIVSLILLQIIINFSGLKIYYGAWIGAYIIGYVLASRYKMDIPNSVGNTIIGLTLILIPIRLYFRYVSGIKSPVMNQFFNRYYVPWTHVLLGICIFVVLYRLFSAVYKNRETNSKIINIISNRSYEIYLTHQIFILGPASLLFATSHLTVNLVLIAVSIAFATWLVYFIDSKIKRK